MNALAKPLALISLLSAAALFGFFYAWVCSTMWGLDVADPRVAIAAMQEMNASVRNGVFAPAFFGAPLLLTLTAMIIAMSGQREPAIWFGIASGFSILLSFVLTTQIHLPMNEQLAQVVIPVDETAAGKIWESYSPRWQLWNQVRAIAMGLAVLCAGTGLLKLR